MRVDAGAVRVCVAQSSAQGVAPRYAEDVIRTPPPPGCPVHLHLDGEGVEPRTVDAVATLDVAAGLLEVMRAHGSEDGRRLEFTGLEVIDKCAQITTWVTGAAPDEVAALTARSVATVTRWSSHAPRGAARAVERARAGLAVLDLPPGGAMLLCAGQELLLDLEEAREPTPQPSMESLRVRVLRVGGEHPRVMVRDVILGQSFTLRTTEAQARRAAENLYREVQIDVSIRRDPSGAIEKDGRLLLVREVLPVGEALGAWQTWVRDLNVDLADIEAERAEEQGRAGGLIDVALGGDP